MKPKIVAFLVASVSWFTVAFAAGLPYPVTGPQTPDVGAIQAELNTLVQQINGSAPFNGFVATAPGIQVNQLVLYSAPTGSMASIGLGPFADANASISINPNGAGNIVLFPPASGEPIASDTGVLQFANAVSFVPVAGLVACPAYVRGGLNPVGLSPTVTGYVVIEDMFGTPHRLAAC